MTTIWVNGSVREPGQAQLGALDHGVTVGDGVFETCKVENSEPFALSRHLRRLARSASVLALDLPSADTIRDAVKETLAAEPIAWGRLRITVTGGDGPLGSERGPSGPSLIVAATSAKPWGDHIAVATVPWTRNERSAVAGAKTTSYAENVVALQAAQRAGASEALLCNTRGEVCEGTGSNVIVVLDDELVTPPLDSGCLAGITRELFLEWAAAEGLPVAERTISASSLDALGGLLLTSSTRDVQPVRELDGRELPVGDLAQAAADLFARKMRQGIDP